ncbi:hypothetical protein [Methylocystis parvus]|uniref:hypothetical protein n=1 Tax=Methylocystis parvus TaxID=134 RepID=UPI003C78B57C
MNFIAQPHFVDAILALVALEAAGILALRAFRGAGPEPVAFLCNLFAGAFLLLALRHALAGGSVYAIALSLAFALAAHLADLALRWDARRVHPTMGKQTAIAQASPNAAPSAPGRGSRVRA